ncbi:MAG: protein kinase [Planctomycetota bacterium]|jgi:tetratricopeptide (TPR) repeat protein/tRNA A-37 threonylcarbamoyl transferase component Bud32|nr:protein kinase [Planctomycetota bacterium]
MFLQDLYLCRAILWRGLLTADDMMATIRDRRRSQDHGTTLASILSREGQIGTAHSDRLLREGWPYAPVDPAMLQIHLLLVSGHLSEPDFIGFLAHPRAEENAWLCHRCLERAKLSPAEKGGLEERSARILESFEQVRESAPHKLKSPFLRLCRLGLEQSLIDMEVVFELLRFRYGTHTTERVTALLQNRSRLEIDQIEQWVSKYFGRRGRSALEEDQEAPPPDICDRTLPSGFDTEIVDFCRGTLRDLVNESEGVQEGSGWRSDSVLPIESLEVAESKSPSVVLDRLGDYELLEEVGRGAMGIVYRARQVDLGRRVALKVLIAGEHASEELIQRFRREAQAAGKLNHPNIVAVHDTGEVDGRHYFSMEFIEGKSAAQEVQESGPLSPRRAAGICQQISSALYAAHRAGIVHRDVKPSNIMLDRCGTAFLSDFGLAADFEASVQLTRTGTAMGTPPYMSPEQVRGERLTIGARSDVYSLGATLYHLLSGQAPYRGDDPFDVCQQVLHTTPPPLRKIDPTISRDIETICLRCMEKDPSRRYRSALTLGEDLSRFLAGHPIKARPPGALEAFGRWVGRNRTLSASLLLALLLAMTYGILVGNRFSRSRSLVECLQEAGYAREQGSYAEAIEAYRKALAIEPSHAGAIRGVDQSRQDLLREVRERVDLGVNRGDHAGVRKILEESEAWLGAMREYQKLRERWVVTSEVRPYQKLSAGLNRVLVDLNTGKDREALVRLRDLCENYPGLESLRMLRVMGGMLAAGSAQGVYRERYAREALEDLNRLAEALPRNWAVALLRSLSYFDSGKLRDALGEMERSLVLLQHQVDVEKNLGFDNRLFRLAQGDSDHFLMFALRERLLIMLNLNRSDTAWGQVSNRDVVVEIAPLKPLVDQLSERFFRQIQGPLEEQFSRYRDRTRLLADFSSGRFAAEDIRIAIRAGVRFFLITGAWKEASKVLSTVGVFLGKGGDAERDLRIDLALERGQFDTVTAYLAEPIRGDSDRLKRAWILLRLADRRREQRRESIRKVIDLLEPISETSSLFPRACLYTGMAWLGLGIWGQAEVELGRAGDLLPGWPEPFLYRGVALRSLGREEEARECWWKVGTLHPGYLDTIGFRERRECYVFVGAKGYWVAVGEGPAVQFELADQQDDPELRIATLKPILFHHAEFSNPWTWLAVLRLCDLSLRIGDQRSFKVYRNVLDTRFESLVDRQEATGRIYRFFKHWSEKDLVAGEVRGSYPDLFAYLIGLKREIEDGDSDGAEESYRAVLENRGTRRLPEVQTWARKALDQLGRSRNR